MKKAVFFLAVMFSVCIYSQRTEPTLEKVGKMVKATYFHENGEVAQTGYLLKGKLHGDWLMYDADGKKTGKWFFWEGQILREVDFADNRIVNVKNWNQGEVVAIQ